MDAAVPGSRKDGLAFESGDHPAIYFECPDAHACLSVDAPRRDLTVSRRTTALAYMSLILVAEMAQGAENRIRSRQTQTT